MSGFTRRAKGLELTFPLSGLTMHEPGEVSEFVQFVHPLFGPLLRIGSSERQRVSAGGAAGVTFVDLVQAPADRVRVVEYAHAQHDDAVARLIEYSLIPAGITAAEVYIQSSLFDAAGAAVPLGAQYPLHRPVALGPGDILRVRISVGAAEIIDARAIYVDYAPTDLAPLVR